MDGDINPAEIDSVAAFGAALMRLKERSGRSLSQLASATVRPEVGDHGLRRSTLNGYFTGRHLPQQGVRREFRSLLRGLGVCGEAQVESWCATVERLRRHSRNGGRKRDNVGTADAARFFGRSALADRLVDQVVARAGSGGPVIVVGPSGAGKSSLLHAGLASRLADAGWRVVTMTPVRSPLTELATRRAGSAEPGRRCLLVVDQLEEMFTAGVDDDERRAFLAAVWSAARVGGVVMGLRADFYGHALRSPELAVVLQTAQVVVGPNATPCCTSSYGPAERSCHGH